MAFVHAPGPHVFHDAGDDYLNLGAPNPHHHFTNSPMHDPNNSGGYYNPNVPSMPCDIKPRLTKEQHDILEAHYQKQNKPNTNTKKVFAESLSVSLDKVNNWFQNRRAKAKQDAKKQAGPYSLYAQAQGSTLNFSSDSDTSPSFTSADYFAMMQQCASDEQLSNGVRMEQMQQQFQGRSPQELSYSTDSTPSEHVSTSMPHQLSVNMFDSPQELNRRTLTQEQFDAFAQDGGILDSSGQLGSLQDGVHCDTDVFQQMFPEIQSDGFKQENVFSFSTLPSNESTVSSTTSERSVYPSSAAMQEHAASSTSSSDWSDSRSSSVSISPFQEASYTQVTAPAPHAAATTSQWQPGHSIPVDPDELQQQFREAAQRCSQQQQQQQQQQQHEQPLAWPADGAFARRESHNSTMLAQQMSSFAIQTPQPQQSATFKTPAPPGEGTSSIAARRQRPRPAALGLASLRSQSYSGAAQPGSPGQQPQNMGPAQQLRRIRSSNVINAVAQGRVMKSVPGPAQRSPLNWTFADSVHSPKITRHASSGSIGNLAPPTPRSPGEQPRQQFPPWQSSSSGDFSRQASISETDAEYNEATLPVTAAPSQNVSSPPHTPRYHHHHHYQPQQQQQHHQQTYQQQSQHVAQARVGSNVITENTPPQSAPAAQQTFPADIFVLPQQQPQAPYHPQQQVPAFIPPQQRQFVNAGVPEQGFHAPVAAYGPAQNFTVTSTQTHSHLPMEFANGVPIVNAQGNLTLAFPPQMHPMQFVQHAPPPAQAHYPQPQAYSSPQENQYNFVTSSGPTTGPQVAAPMPNPPAQQTTEFFVHEYSPPQEIKRQATQRKATIDSGPKNYTFANQGPEHFEKEKPKKGQDVKPAAASSSPSSATATSTSQQHGAVFQF